MSPLRIGWESRTVSQTGRLSRQAEYYAMLKWAALVVALLVCAFVLFLFAHDQSVRGASLTNGKNQLLAAYDAFTKTGQITNDPSSGYQVRLSTNVVTIAGTQYPCFAEAGGGLGYDGG